MRKLTLLLASSLVLLGVMGLGAQAAWAGDPEPECAGQPDGIRGFHFLTVPDTELVAADVYGGAALCGTDVNWLGTIKGAYKMGYILTPGDMDSQKGVTVRCANPDRPNNDHHQYCDNNGGDDVESGSFAGNSYTGLEQCFLGALCSYNPTNSNLFVDDAGTLNPDNSHCDPVTVVQCLQSTDNLGLGTTDITVQPCWALRACREAKAPNIPDLDPMQDRYLMTIYQVNTLIPGTEAYYTTIGQPDYEHPGGEPSPQDFHLCKYASSPGGSSCGSDPARWIQKNSPAGTYGCGGGKPEGEAARATTIGNIGPIPDACTPYSWTS